MSLYWILFVYYAERVSPYFYAVFDNPTLSWQNKLSMRFVNLYIKPLESSMSPAVEKYAEYEKTEFSPGLYKEKLHYS